MAAVQKKRTAMNRFQKHEKKCRNQTRKKNSGLGQKNQNHDSTTNEIKSESTPVRSLKLIESVAGEQRIFRSPPRPQVLELEDLESENLYHRRKREKHERGMLEKIERWEKLKGRDGRKDESTSESSNATRTNAAAYSSSSGAPIMKRNSVQIKRGVTHELRGAEEGRGKEGVENGSSKNISETSNAASQEPDDVTGMDSKPTSRMRRQSVHGKGGGKFRGSEEKLREDGAGGELERLKTNERHESHKREGIG